MLFADSASFQLSTGGEAAHPQGKTTPGIRPARIPGDVTQVDHVQDRWNQTSIIIDFVDVRFTLLNTRRRCTVVTEQHVQFAGQFSLAWVRVIETPDKGHAYQVRFPASGSW